LPSKKDDKRHYEASAAEAKHPSKERVEELRQEGKTDSEVAVILKSEGYNVLEMTRALPGYGPGGLKALREGRPPERTESGEGRTVQVRRDERTLNTGSEEERGEMSGEGEQGSGQTAKISNRYQPESERGKALMEVISTATGINPAKAASVLKFYEAHQEDFDANPIRLMAMLQTAGLSWIKAQSIMSEFLMQVDPDQVLGPFIGGQGGEGQNVAPWMQKYLPDAGRGGRQTFAEKMDAMMDKMLEVRMMAGLSREIMGGMGGGASGEDAEDKAENRRQDRMMNRMMMTLMMGNMGGNRNQAPQGGPMTIYETEPLLDEDGKVVKDESGNPILRTRQTPMMSAAGGDSTRLLAETLKEVAIGKANGGGEGGAVKYLADALKSSADSRAELAETMSRMIKDMSEQQFAMLQTRIQGLEASDPLDMVDSILDKVKEWGFGQKGETNVEIAKMDQDLKKWMHTENVGLQKWIMEQKNAARDKEYARTQLKEFGQTVRTGIEKIGVPMANAAAGGFAKARNGQNGTGAQGGGGARAAPPAGGKEVKNLSDEELLGLYSDAGRTEKTVEDAKKRLVAEIQARGLNI
jgi:hypothetical protein